MKLNVYLDNQPHGFATQMARDLKIPPPKISHWRNGYVRPDHESVKKIVAYTDGAVTAYDLHPQKYEQTIDKRDVKLRKGICEKCKPTYNV